MSTCHKISLSTVFLLGVSKEKAKLVFTVLSLHSAAERILNAIFEIKNEKPPKKFSCKLKVVDNLPLQDFLKELNRARNACAHRSPHFNEEEVVPILQICSRLIEMAKEVNVEKFRAFEEMLPSSLAAAAAVVFELTMGHYKIEENDPIVLDGYCLPGRKSLADKITEIVGSY